MRTLFASTATAIMLATTALADGHATTTYEFNETNDFFASTLIGMRVYTSEQEYDADTVPANTQTEWDDIGEINDLVVSKDGKVQAAIIGVGGFIGIGERDVALGMDQIRVLTEDDDPNERFLVVNMTKEMLENAPAFEREDDAMETAETDTNAVVTDENTEVAASDTIPERDYLTPPNVSMDGYEMTSVDKLTAEDLDGAYVYGARDESVGEIGELLLTDDGKIDRAVINVGGFLGIGEKPIAVTFDELQLLRNESGDLRVYIDATQEALEAQPEYEG